MRVEHFLRRRVLSFALIILIFVFSSNVIASSNTTPTKPVLIGVNSGKINTTYTFTAFSTDSDDDLIKYAFSFGDNSNLVFSDFLTSGTSFTSSHSWDSPGLYVVNVNVKDSQNSFSDTTELNVLINAKFIGLLGYIIDSDNDGIYDQFYSNSTGEIANIERFDIYLIDIDNDGTYDYRYNTSNGDIQSLQVEDSSEDDNESSSEFGIWIPLMFFGIILFIVALFFILTFRTKKVDEEEPKPTTDFSFLVKEEKKEVEEKPIFVEDLKREFDRTVVERELEDKEEKSKDLQDIEKYIDDL